MIKDVSLPVSNKIICGLIWCVFVALSLYIAPYHEVWADEVQAFLIARDASVADIISAVPHQEGQPSLWHLVLKGFIFVFGENLNITYVSIFIMSLTVGIFLFLYNVPLLYKILIPFGHYFLYQYNIISRNYCLAYLALALLGYIYPLRHKYIWRYAFVLLLLAESTSFLAPVAAVLGLLWLYEAYQKGARSLFRYAAPMFMLACFGLLMIWQIFPLNYSSYSLRIGDIKNYPYSIFVHFPEAFFAGENLIVNLLFLLGIAFCAIRAVMSVSFWKSISSHQKTICYVLVLWGTFSIVYFAARPMFYHQGLIWGIFLCSLYMFFPDYVCQRKHYLFVACLLMQIYWSFGSIYFDIKQPYSAQFDAMKILQQHHPKAQKIQAIGFHTLPLEFLLSQNQMYPDLPYPLYWLWTPNDLKYRYDDEGLQKRVDEHRDILVVDAYEAPRVNLDFYENTDNFYIYKVPAAAVYKGYLFYEQGLNLYIKKSLGEKSF